MRRPGANLMAWLLMVGYLLAATGAVWFHRHDRSLGSHQEAAHYIHAHGGYPHQAFHHYTSPPHSPHFRPQDDERVPIRIPRHGDDCFVCRFLSKTSTAASRVAFEEVGNVVCDVVEPILATPDSPALGLAQSRAPPVAVS